MGQTTGGVRCSGHAQANNPMHAHRRSVSSSRTIASPRQCPCSYWHTCMAQSPVAVQSRGEKKQAAAPCQVPSHWLRLRSGYVVMLSSASDALPASLGRCGRPSL